MKLSVITICYNNAEGLRKTLESARRQTWQDFEHIVIDGGSTDGTREVLEEYDDYLDYWVSEPDKGIYNAMNKGVRAAHGEYCQFLNSGDWLYADDVYEKVMHEGLTADICTGNTQMDRGGIFPSPAEVTLDYLYNGSLSHPASFIRRERLVATPYDESYRIIADHKYFLQDCVLNNATYQQLNTLVATFDLTGISSTNAKLKNEEHQRMFKELIPERILADYVRRKTDLYRLFADIERSPYKWKLYNFNVFVIKLLKFNRGWTRKLQFHK